MLYSGGTPPYSLSSTLPSPFGDHTSGAGGKKKSEELTLAPRVLWCGAVLCEVSEIGYFERIILVSAETARSYVWNVDLAPGTFVVLFLEDSTGDVVDPEFVVGTNASAFLCSFFALSLSYVVDPANL